MQNPETQERAPQTPQTKPSKDHTDLAVITGEIETGALDVLDEATLKELKRLKKIVDSAKGQNKLYAIEKLMVTAYKKNLLKPEVLEKIGFSFGVAKVLVDIANEQATVRQLDEVWND